MSSSGVLTFFCGKMGAGKSTMALSLAQRSGAVLLAEDEWLSTLYPDEIRVFDDYIKYSARLKPLLQTHVRNILKSGLSVIMDFPGNTPEQRSWFREIFSGHDIPHKLIYLELADELCLEQIAYRRESSPERAHFDTEEVFHQVTSYFSPPVVEEGFNVEIIARGHA